MHGSGLQLLILQHRLQLPDAMDADSAAAANGSIATKAAPEPVASRLPEVEAYASLLVLLLLTDGKHWDEVGAPP